MNLPSQFLTKKNVYTDIRGSLVDISNKDNLAHPELPANVNIYSFTINPGVSRGHHYHELKQEWFFCVHGEVIVYLKDVNTLASYSVKLSAFDGKVIYLPTYTAHALLNKSLSQPAVIVSYSSKSHDPINPDTYKMDLTCHF